VYKSVFIDKISEGTLRGFLINQSTDADVVLCALKTQQEKYV
jgi:hypothetical protein